MESPIQSDPEVLEAIYWRFDYLRDHPLKLRASFIVEAVSLGTLHAEDFFVFLMACEVEAVKPVKDPFPFLSAEENLSVTHYCSIRPVVPWPQPRIGITWNNERGEGRVTGTHEVDVILRPVGEAQLWWGNATGVIWEGFFERDIRAREDHELLMHGLWEGLEGYLAAQGVSRVYTHDRDLVFEDAWYRGFLKEREYQPVGEGAVVKVLSEQYR
jgi:hypothetical protein